MSINFKSNGSVELVTTLVQVTTVVFVAYIVATVGVLATHAAECQNSYGTGSAAPTGYGVAYNLFSTARERLVEGTDCTTTSATVQVGSGNAAQFVYNKGYYWTGSAWQEYALTSASTLQGGVWYTGKATGNIQLPQTVTYVVGYVCQQANGVWKCGCRDTACSNGYWQLQAVKGAAAEPPSTGGGGGGSGDGSGSGTGDGSFNGTGPSSARRAGVHTGVSFWTLPNTPNGLKPSQTWGGAGTTPTGGVYIGGMDHKTNSALYRLYNDKLYYVGDAKSASQQANNWKSGEVAEKFHTRPTWMNGSMYVATMNASELNNNYLSQPGFHWYGYDITGNKFTDLNAALPGRTAAEHGSIVTLAPDVKRNILYGAMHPTGDLYAYYPGEKKSTKLGRPAYNRALVYPGRWMWVDSTNGRLYFTAGNDAIGYYGGSYDPAIFNHVRYYDPQTGFGEMKNWTLHNQRAIDAGQCSNGTCYMMDNKGHIYRFTEAGPTWSYIGAVANFPPSSTTDITWVFSVDFAKLLAYVVVSGPTTLYEFNLQTGASKNLGSLESYEPELKKYSVLYGHDAWSNGSFYFAALGTDPNLNVTLVGIDPVKFKQAIGK